MEMLKLRFRKPTMTELLVAVVVLCISSKTPGAFVLADDEGLEFTTEFDISSRGSLKFGDKCEMTQQCGFAGSICYQSECTCSPLYMSTNHVDKCGKAASVNETCFFNEQCEDSIPETECRDGKCICRFDKTPVTKKDGSIECIAIKEEEDKPPSVNPTMYFILAVMALMFVIICVVLRLFARARWRENRTIFNTPNPRLMNVSLLRDNKLLHGGERRGSRISVRMPSRQPSMASLRPHSPNASIGSTSSNGPHTVVTNPNDLLIVNLQQHQRRRSSFAIPQHPPTAQHLPITVEDNQLQTEEEIAEDKP